MAKQVFEFTAEEVAQIIWEYLVKEGKHDGSGTGEISVTSRRWKEKGFDVTIKVG